MTDVVVPEKSQKPNKLVMAISFLLALPLAAVLLIHPALILDANGEYSHRVMMLIMIGISGGFVYGVGFIPKFWVWKWMFSPFLSWPLMLWGYYTWFVI